MAKLEVNYSAMNNGQGKSIVDDLVVLTKANMAGQKGTEAYGRANKEAKDRLAEFSAMCCGNLASLGADFDHKTDAGFANLMSLPQYNSIFFSAILSTLKQVNAKEEIQQIMPFVQVLSGAEGDSLNMLMNNNPPFVVEGTGYSNASTLNQFRFGDNKTLTPTPKEASFAFDLHQYHSGMMDLGDSLAKLANSFRIADQQAACEAVFDSTDLQSTPFYLPTYDTEAYIALADRISSANGNVPTAAYGSKIALHRLAEGSVAGVNAYGTVDEMIKNGYVKDIHGIPSVALDQSVNQVLNYRFKVPNNMIVLSPINAKIARLFMEGYYHVIKTDNTANLANMFQIITSSAAAACPDGVHGIQVVGAPLY